MFEKRSQELIEKANFIQALGSIYNKVVAEMNWNAMDYHESDDEHDEAWFTEPNEDASEWQLTQLRAYKAVLDSIEKLAK